MKTRSLYERFIEKVDIKGPDDCWLRKGTAPAGYGQIRGDKSTNFAKLRSHRVSYEIFVGPIPEGMLVCHRCDVPLCVNPNHLFLGTSLDNNIDMVKKGRANYPGCPITYSDELIAFAKDLRKDGETYQRIADITGMSIAHAYRVINGQRR